MTSNRGNSEDIPVAGGVDLPLRHIGGVDADDPSAPSDELGRRLYTLRQLHPEVELSFRQEDIDKMDEATKRVLINDFEVILGIEPLKSCVS